MAFPYYTWNAPLTAQVDSFTPANVATTNTFTITISNKSVTFTAGGSDTVATVSAGLAALAAATDYAEFNEIAWTATSAACIATANTPGKNFIATSSATGGTASLTAAVVTANSGPSDASCTANYSTGALPSASDTLTIANGSTDILYGLTALSGISLTALNINASFTGKLGLAEFNPSGYAEYRPQYAVIHATTISVGVQDVSGGAFGQNVAQGSGRIKIDSSTNATNVYVYQTGNAVDAPLEPMLWKGTSTSNTLTVQKGSVGVAVLPGEVADLANWSCSYVSSKSSDANIRFGTGVVFNSSVGTITGGTVKVQTNITTVTNTGGNLTVAGTATVGTLNNYGGSTYYQSTGTCTTCNMSSLVDFSQNGQPRTFTNINLYKGFNFNDPNGTVTPTNGWICVGCRLSDGTLNIGFAPTILL